MTADPFSTVKTELPRDRWGRPLITPPEGGDPVAYQRVTTFVGALEDTYHLSLWAQRMVALGMTRRRDLVLAASAISDPDDKIQKRNLNDIAKQAKDAAQGSAAAITGTAIHAFTERIDRGEQLTDVPEEHAPDLEAYRGITTGLVALGIEGFCVCDGLRVGGSYDRIYQFTDLFLGRYADKHGAPLTYPGADGQAGQKVKAGDVVIADLKTGNVDYGLGKIAMQLGVYAHSEDYDHTLGTRTPLAGGPSKEWALVIHLPAGMGSARLLWVNIAAGWQGRPDSGSRRARLAQAQRPRQCLHIPDHDADSRAEPGRADQRSHKLPGAEGALRRERRPLDPRSDLPGRRAQNPDRGTQQLTQLSVSRLLRRPGL